MWYLGALQRGSSSLEGKAVSGGRRERGQQGKQDQITTAPVCHAKDFVLSWAGGRRPQKALSRAGRMPEGRRASRRSIPPASPWSSTSPPDCTSLPGSPQLCVPQLAAEQKQHQRERRVPIPHQKNTPNLSLLVPAIQVSTGVELSQHTQLD